MGKGFRGVCLCAKERIRARVEKKNSWKKRKEKENLWKERKRVGKEVKMSSKCCLLKKGSKYVKSSPKCCMNLPLCLKVDFCIQKWILSVNFITLLAIALRTFVYPYLSLLANTLAPLQPYTSILSVMCFNMWRLGLAWAYGIHGSCIEVVAFRSWDHIYTHVLINSRKCLLCYKHIWVLVYMITSIFSYIPSIRSVVRKSVWK